MKTKTILMAVLLVAIIVGATLLYNVLSEGEGPAELPLLTTRTPETGGAENSPSPGDINETRPPPDEEDNGDTEQFSMAPDFTVQDINGNNVSLSDMRGKPVVLNFWASWCPPCKQEMPDFNKVYDDLGTDVSFMMVCMADGTRETTASGAAFIEEQGYTFPIYFDVSHDAAMKYGIRAIPSTFFIDADGYLISNAEGMIDEATMRLGIGYITE